MTLERIIPVEFWSEREQEQVGKMLPTMDLSELSGRREGAFLIVRVGLFLAIRSWDGTDLCSVQATWDYRYLGDIPRTKASRRDLAVGNALPTAWVGWLQHVSKTLGELGFGPVPLRPTLPDSLVALGRQEYEER